MSVSIARAKIMVAEAVKSLEIDVSWIEEHKRNPKLDDQEILLKNLKDTIETIKSAMEPL